MSAWPMAILLALGAYGVYAPVIDVWNRQVDSSVLRRGSTRARRIALTFDDGASANAGIVRRMLADGHLVGSHTQSHRHAYALDPLAAWLEVVRGVTNVSVAAGTPVDWFRPPWGACNLVTRIAATACGQRLAMWSIMGGDWRRDQRPKSIADRVTHALQPGAIIVLHDAGGQSGAPENTVGALPILLAAARALGYEWSRLDRLAAR